MTHEAALATAAVMARETGVAVDVWEHTGDAKHPPQGRFVPVAIDAPPPRHGRWTTRERVTPQTDG